MAKKTIEMDLKITFTQCVEVEVDDDMLSLIEDNWCQEINIMDCHKNGDEKKISDFLRTLPTNGCNVFLRRYWYFMFWTIWNTNSSK